MSIDLERELTDLARSVHDDGVTERMNGQVRHMVTRIRRRRAARHSATGVIGVGAVAAVAVAGLQLADRFPGPVPPAATEPSDPTPYLVTGALLRCGEPAPAATDLDETGLHLVPEFSDSAGAAADFAGGDLPTVDVLLVNGTEDEVTVRRTEGVTAAVVHDGVVVSLSVSADPGITTGDLPPGAGYTMSTRAVLLNCDTSEPLPEGEYEVVVAITVEDATHGRVVTLVGEPVGFTITDSPLDEEVADAEAAIQAIIAASAEISAEYPFGVCGTRVPATASDLLTIDMELASLSYAAGDLMEGTANITAVDGLTVLGNAPITAVHVVLVRDGVVVGRGHYDPEYVDLITFTPDRPYPLPALGNALLCGLPTAQAPDFELPAGTYQAYGTLDVALKEVQFADGSAESPSGGVVARSEPVDVVIGTPGW